MSVLIASGLLGQFQSVDSVAMGNTSSQWPGARSAEVTSHQRTWRTTYAADEDEEAWRHDPNLFVFDLPE
ncbi:hypothetical protein PDIDSM_4140 [Penicillium digitatum]|nr:hypothetical protein PDIDSM_4140 [Penicillium digitatum]